METRAKNIASQFLNRTRVTVLSLIKHATGVSGVWPVLLIV
jgi:hypothetical protein